jgi:predicted ribosome quality control (RQC) complex YloA/Tae2 family protein
MITNYYTLFHLTNELNRLFFGHEIHEVFTQSRGELVVAFSTTESVILIGCESSDNYLYTRSTYARARKNSKTLFSGLSKKKILKISLNDYDREITVVISDGFSLIVQLFGSKANVYLCDSNGIVRERFLQKTDRQKIHTHTGCSVDEQYVQDSTLALITILKQMLPQFGSILIQELLFRSSLQSHVSWSDLSQTEIERLSTQAVLFKQDLLSDPSPRIYLKDSLPIRFSIISLNSYSSFTSQPYDSISFAIQMYRSALYRGEETHRKKNHIMKTLEHEMEHVDSALTKIKNDLEPVERANQYNNFGKILISQLHLFHRGDSVATLKDIAGNSEDLIEIPLDIHLAPVKNAERYFEKAKKSQHKVVEQHQRILILERQQEDIASLLLRIDDVSTAEDLKIYFAENGKQLSRFGIKSEKTGQLKKERPLPFRVFTIEGGFQVWAGKSGENNDLLSTRYTAKNDLWFHARGVGGSHVVLKTGTGKGEISKLAINQAAAIAAYYSKMKNSKLVPVTMCEGKYVRKTKNAPAGTVVVEREKTVFVEPALPKSGLSED